MLADQLRVAQRTVAAQTLLIELLLRERAAVDHGAGLTRWLEHQQHGVVEHVPIVQSPPPPPPRKVVRVALSSEQLGVVARHVLDVVAALVLTEHGVELVWRSSEDGGTAPPAELGVAFFGLKTSRTQPIELAGLVQRLQLQLGSGNVLVVTSRTWNKASPTAQDVSIEDYVLENRHTMPSDANVDVAAVLSGVPLIAMHHKFAAGSDFVPALESVSVCSAAASAHAISRRKPTSPTSVWPSFKWHSLPQPTLPFIKMPRAASLSCVPLRSSEAMPPTSRTDCSRRSALAALLSTRRPCKSSAKVRRQVTILSCDSSSLNSSMVALATA